MGNTGITGQQINDGAVGRPDLNITISGQSVIRKVLEDGGPIYFTSTGADAGTGDVTISHRTGAGYNHIPTGGATGNILQWSASGTAVWGTPGSGISLTDLSATTPLSYINTTGVFSIQVANTTQSGYLTSTDWNTFNNKQNTITPNALTKTDDTNVTITLGGSPSTALLVATSITLGWTGTLADERIASAATWNGKQTGHVNLTSLATLTYASASFVKMTGSGTFALDTNIYVTGTPWTSVGYLQDSEFTSQGIMLRGATSGTYSILAATNLTSISALSYVSSSFVKMTSAGTFTLDTTTYVSGTPWTAVGYVISGGALGTPSSGTLTNCTFPTLNQSTTGSAATLTTARTIAGTSFNGSANITLANKFIVQGTSDAGLTGAQFLGALGTGIVKNTTTTGALTIATGADLPTMTSTIGGAVPTPPNNTTTYLRGDGTFAALPASTISYTTTVTSVSTVTLTVSSSYYQFFTGSTAQKVVLPVTSTLTLGQQFYLANNSSALISVYTSDGTTLIMTMAVNGDCRFTCILTSGTTAVSWDYKYLASGVASGKVMTFNNSLTFTGTDATTITFQATDTYVGRTTTDTLTNKRNQPRIISSASYTTSTTPDVSTADIWVITAQAGSLLFNNPTGTPVQGEKFMIRIKDSGTARALTYGTQYRALGNALPTTTVISKIMYMGFIYNSTDTKWDLIALSTEA